MQEIMIQTIGYVAGALISVGIFPQLYKTFKTKQAGDIAIKTPVLIASGSALWVGYGLAIQAYPVVLTNLLAFLSNVCLIYFCVRYDR